MDTQKATPKQELFIAKLVMERKPDVEFTEKLMRMVEEGKLTRSIASRVISILMHHPKPMAH